MKLPPWQVVVVFPKLFVLLVHSRRKLESKRAKLFLNLLWVFTAPAAR